MSSDKESKPEKQNPNQDSIPKPKDDFFKKGYQGVPPPKPKFPDQSDNGASEGVPGWTPPKSDE